MDYTKPEFIYKEYFCNGQLKSKGIVINGRKEGEWEYFSEDGILINKEVYKNGVLKR